MRLLLNTCAEIEGVIGEIYRYFADQVVCPERLRDIWLKMASDEDRHARDIRFFARVNLDKELALEKLSRVQADQYLSRVRSILAGIKISEIKEGEALRVSKKLEQDLLDVHLTLAVEILDEKTSRMFSCIVQNEKEHLAEIESYVRSTEDAGGKTFDS